MAIIKLAEKEFIEKMGRDEFSAVLEFYADWCKPCDKTIPVIEKLSAQYPQIEFYKIDADEEVVLAAALNASILPALVFVKDGIVIDIIEGNVPEEKILAAMEKIK